MRARFAVTTAGLLDEQPNLAAVLGDIGTADFARAARAHPDRVINVGIREALMVSVAGGLALTGMRPVVHTYAPFLVERAYEQLKLDLGHQDVGAVLVSIGASYDASSEGRTHQSPADVGLVAALPGWTVHVPGHPDEVESMLRQASTAADRQYLRLSEATNTRAYPTDGRLHLVRDATGPLVVAVGPVLDDVLAATSDLPVRVAYTSTPHPLDAAGLRELALHRDVVVVEPVLAGTSAAAVTAALADRAIRLTSVGVRRDVELRQYGTPADHRRWHGLDAAGIASTVRGVLDR